MSVSKRSSAPLPAMVLAWGAGSAEGDAKYGPDTWRGRDPKIDMIKCVGHLARAILDPSARDADSGELHLHHAFARLAIAVENTRTK